MRWHPMKRLLLIIPMLSTIMVAPMLLSGCESGGGIVSLTIDPPEVVMQSRGENVQLKAVGKKADGSLATDDEMDLRWSYSDGSIASVDKSGLLRGVLPGDATVGVKSERYGKSATIKVQVKPPKFTPSDMQAKVQSVIDVLNGLSVSPSTADDPEGAASLMKDILRSLTESHKYIGQGTNNTLASVEMLNAANYMDMLASKSKGALAEGLTDQAQLTRQYREELFAY